MVEKSTKRYQNENETDKYRYCTSSFCFSHQILFITYSHLFDPGISRRVKASLDLFSSSYEYLEDRMARDVSLVLFLLPGSGKITVLPGVPKFTDSLGQSIRPRGRGELKCACIVHNFGGLPLASIETKLAQAHREGVLCTLCSKIVHFIFTAFLSFFRKSMKFDMTVTSSQSKCRLELWVDERC